MPAENIVSLIENNQYEFVNVLSYILVYFAILWILFCLWVLKDISSRTRNPLHILLSVFFVFVLNLPGLLLYLMLRPEKTIEEAKALDIHLLSQLEDGLINCGNCTNIMRRHYKFCTICGASLLANCESCNKQINPIWLSCAHCGVNLQPLPAEKLNHRVAVWLMGLKVKLLSLKSIRFPKFRRSVVNAQTELANKLQKSKKKRRSLIAAVNPNLALPW